jgi:UDP-GlcNAc:undecaprenyl-phosphate GlcNAc-1-phosphate transferase
MEEGMQSALGAILPFAAALIAIPVLMRVAPSAGLVDHPGGRKDHTGAVPLVGGIAIYLSLLPAAFATGLFTQFAALLAALAIVLLAGVADDIFDIRPLPKFAAQIAACLVMIYAGGVELLGVGNLAGFGPIFFFAFALPMTLFAAVGVINAINMMDGMDGVAGSIALGAFAWYCAVAWMQGLHGLQVVALMFCGALAAFLAFNLRYPRHPRARIFLGDAGSMVLGFALAWFAIDLTHGPGRSFPPICALWVLLLPLADCVSLMSRRVRAGKSPFVADREHLHHYLAARGLSHAQVFGVMLGFSAFFGAVGFFGWRLGVPEPVLFWPFFFLYFAYHYAIKRAWKRMHARAGTGAVPAVGLES